MVDLARAVLAVLTRAPSAGGKSRLFQTLGMAPDAGLLRALLLDTLDGVAVPGLRRVIAVTPGSACDEVRTIAGGIDVMPQPDGDLGARMQAAMETTFGQGADAVAVIGSDLPHIAPGTVADGFAALARDRDALVLGPAADGGYYLIGARRPPGVFAGMEWGSAQVLARTVQVASSAGFRVHQLPTLADVDTADDLRAAIRTGRAPRCEKWISSRQ